MRQECVAPPDHPRFDNFLAGLSIAPTVASQPIEPLGSTRPTAPAAPADVAEAPADATKTDERPGLEGAAKRRGNHAPRPPRQGHHQLHRLDARTARSSPARSPTASRGRCCWTTPSRASSEGLLLMVKGEKRRLWIPAELATTGRPKRRGPPGPSVFDVELVDITKMPDPIPVPEDVAAAPADAKRTASGLAYKFLKRGKGKDAPDGRQHRRGPLQRLDARRKDVRQLRAPRRADPLPAERRDQGLDRRRPADGRRRQGALLDPGRARLRRQARSARARPPARWSSTSSCCRSNSAA